MLGPRGRLFTAALLAVIASLYSVAGTALADLSLCAFRSGPKGPCTCKAPGDTPGQFTVAKRSFCLRASKAPKREADAEELADKATAPQKDIPPPSARPSGTEAAQQLTISPEAGKGIVTGANPSTLPSRLDAVRARGALACGVNERLLGFSYQSNTGDWAGIDADFCRAIAAAVLGDPAKVEFIALDTSSRFEALKSGKIDVLSRNTTWNMSRDVDLGLEFAGVLYFDGQSFITSDERGFVSAQQLAGARVCVQSATTTEANMAYYFKEHGLTAETKTFPSRDEMIKAYLAEDCDAYSADRSSLFADRAGFDNPTRHAVLPEVISKEPLGPAVLQGDQEWTEIVRWVLAGLINAEEVGLAREAAANGKVLEGDARRLVEGAGGSGEKLRLDRQWLRNVIAAVGNYGELYDTNIGKGGALGMERGINALWKNGGILYAPPMW
ncbi:MAG: amino acid ABC transporter substrate-binding protein [Hyphomicrobiaceae bacterium]